MDSDYKKLDNKAEELSKELVKQNSAYQHKKQVLEQEEALLQKNQKSQESIKKDINKSKEQVKGDHEAFAQLESKNKELATKYKELQKQLQDALAGIASEGVSDSATVAEQIMGMCLHSLLSVFPHLCVHYFLLLLIEAKRDATNSKSEINKAVVKIKHLESELASKRKTVQTTDSELKKLLAVRDQAEKELAAIKVSLSLEHLPIARRANRVLIFFLRPKWINYNLTKKKRQH